MSDFNRGLRFRPLMAGVAVHNPIVNELGTLGLIARDDVPAPGPKRWLVSCFHVIAARPGAAPTPAAPIHQPRLFADPVPIANLDAARLDAALDAAAAVLTPGAAALPRILGLGAQRAPMAPTIGMAVVKAGLATGVTEGVIDQIQNEIVRIVPHNGAPPEYELCGARDSGAVWLDIASMRPVAMLTGSDPAGTQFAMAVSVEAALASLRLRMVEG